MFHTLEAMGLQDFRKVGRLYMQDMRNIRSVNKPVFHSQFSPCSSSTFSKNHVLHPLLYFSNTVLGRTSVHVLLLI